MDDKKLIGIDALAKTLATEFPGINVEVMPSYDDMLFLYRIGAATGSCGRDHMHSII